MKYDLPNVLERRDNDNEYDDEISHQNYEFSNTNKGG